MKLTKTRMYATKQEAQEYLLNNLELMPVNDLAALAKEYLTERFKTKAHSRNKNLRELALRYGFKLVIEKSK